MTQLHVALRVLRYILSRFLLTIRTRRKQQAAPHISSPDKIFFQARRSAHLTARKKKSWETAVGRRRPGVLSRGHGKGGKKAVLISKSKGFPIWDKNTSSKKFRSDSSHIFHFIISKNKSRPFLCCSFGDFDETPAGAPRETAQDEATLGTLTLCHLGAGEGGGEEGRNLHQETITGSHKESKEEAPTKRH